MTELLGTWGSIWDITPVFRTPNLRNPTFLPWLVPSQRRLILDAGY